MSEPEHASIVHGGNDNPLANYGEGRGAIAIGWVELPGLHISCMSDPAGEGREKRNG